LLVVGHRANTRRWLRRQAVCSDLVEIDVVDEEGVLRSGHRGPAGSPVLLRERLGRRLEELRFTPSPLLVDLLSLVPRGVGVMLDLKAPVEPRRLRRVVEEAGLAPTGIYVSTRWHNLGPGLAGEGFRVLLSMDSRPASLSVLAGEAAAAGVSVRHSYVDRGLVEEAHSLGLVVAAWTVNRREEALRVAQLGVDMVVTDTPCRLRGWLGGR
jgi:glycerophosphoryl diester phosphodiesterase